MKQRTFRVVFPHNINVDGRLRVFGEEFVIDVKRCDDIGIPGLLANKYLKEVK